MKKTIALTLGIALLTGCVSYHESADGSISFVSVLKKSQLKGVRVGQLEIEGATTAGDTEMLKAGVDAAVTAAIKGVKP
jgi:hypothetical protein